MKIFALTFCVVAIIAASAYGQERRVQLNLTRILQSGDTLGGEWYDCEDNDPAIISKELNSESFQKVCDLYLSSKSGSNKRVFDVDVRTDIWQHAFWIECSEPIRSIRSVLRRYLLLRGAGFESEWITEYLIRIRYIETSNSTSDTGLIETIVGKGCLRKLSLQQRDDISRATGLCPDGYMIRNKHFVWILNERGKCLHRFDAQLLEVKGLASTVAEAWASWREDSKLSEGSFIVEVVSKKHNVFINLFLVIPDIGFIGDSLEVY